MEGRGGFGSCLCVKVSWKCGPPINAKIFMTLSVFQAQLTFKLALFKPLKKMYQLKQVINQHLLKLKNRNAETQEQEVSYGICGRSLSY